MQFDDWVKVVKDAFSIGCRRVQFIGGEPTLCPELPRLIRLATSLGFEVIEVFTNGTHLNVELLTLFHECRTNLAFSLYSCYADIHDQITQVRGSFHRTVSGIQQALALGVHVRVAIIEINGAVQEIEQTKQFLQSLGVRKIDLDGVRGIGRGSQVAGLNERGTLCGDCGDRKLAIDSLGRIFPCVFSRCNQIGDTTQGLCSILQSDKLIEFRQQMGMARHI